MTERIIGCSGGNLHDIDHFLKVYALAETIGEREGLDGEAQTALEVAAVLHDIACPL
ncbi:HD domain-containing protein [Bittarella sp. HCP28S3_D9]|uniref:HD domain-containing protein n=1 Tax=Bittarella sp. HCP28S3_D9 TaxID=3440253 RepID=UPI003F8CB7CC